jgi:hypothetical protein
VNSPSGGSVAGSALPLTEFCAALTTVYCRTRDVQAPADVCCFWTVGRMVRIDKGSAAIPPPVSGFSAAYRTTL